MTFNLCDLGYQLEHWGSTSASALQVRSQERVKWGAKVTIYGVDWVTSTCILHAVLP